MEENLDFYLVEGDQSFFWDELNYKFIYNDGKNVIDGYVISHDPAYNSQYNPKVEQCSCISVTLAEKIQERFDSMDIDCGFSPQTNLRLVCGKYSIAVVEFLGKDPLDKSEPEREISSKLDLLEELFKELSSDFYDLKQSFITLEEVYLKEHPVNNGE